MFSEDKVTGYHPSSKGYNEMEVNESRTEAFDTT